MGESISKLKSIIKSLTAQLSDLETGVSEKISESDLKKMSNLKLEIEEFIEKNTSKEGYSEEFDLYFDYTLYFDGDAVRIENVNINDFNMTNLEKILMKNYGESYFISDYIEDIFLKDINNQYIKLIKSVNKYYDRYPDSQEASDLFDSLIN